MPTAAGEFFVNLGIKGAEKDVTLLQSVEGGLNNIKSSSLAAKAAIVAAFYELGKAVDASGTLGMDLKNFEALTGIPARTLQAYNRVATEAMGKNEDLSGTFTRLQRTMADAALNGSNAWKGLNLVLAELQRNGINVDQNEILGWRNDPTKLVQRIQQFMKATKNDPGLRNAIAGMFQFNDEELAMLARGIFSPEKLRAAMAKALSHGQIENLAQEKEAWAAMGQNVSSAWNKLMSNKDALRSIQEVTEAVNNLALALGNVVEKSEALGVLANIFKTLGSVVPQRKGTVKGGFGIPIMDEVFEGQLKDYQRTYGWHPPMALGRNTKIENSYTIPVTVQAGANAYETGRNVGQGAVSVIGSREKNNAVSQYGSAADK